MLSVVVTIVVGCVIAEICGYGVHHLLHSEKVPWLARTHMLHHLRDYGPKKGLRHNEYICSADDRFSILSVGIEWVVPLAILESIAVSVMLALGVAWYLQIIFFFVTLGWGYVFYSYMHDAMHIKGFWMERNSVLGKWFRNARRLHDLHHLDLTNDGRMRKNYGICFFFLDRLLGSLANKRKPFNDAGYEAAQKRYAFIYDT